MRTTEKQKILGTTMHNLCMELDKQLKLAGFITDVNSYNRTTINLGLHMKSFIVDHNLLGYNARLDHGYRATIKGFTRTSIPTWSQREDYNHIVNNVLDQFDVVCNVKSGEYIVRTRDNGRIDNWSYINPSPNCMFGPVEIVELCDDLIEQGKENLRIHRREKRTEKLAVKPTEKPLEKPTEFLPLKLVTM